MRKLVIHVGAPKCGSSVLQSILGMLEDNGELARKNYTYPLTFSRGNGQGNGGLLFHFFKDGDLKGLSEFISEIKNSNNNMIISDEMLYGVVNRNKFEKLYSILTDYFDRIEVYICIREPSSWLLSDFSQYIKQQLPVSDVVEHIAKREIHCNWPVQLRRFDFQLKKTNSFALDYRNILPVFSKLIGFSRNHFLELSRNDGINANASLSDSDMEFLRLKSLGLVSNENYSDIKESLQSFNYREEYKHLIRYIKMKHCGYESKLPLKLIK